MFEEDPFDRWCRTLVEVCGLVTVLAELLIRQLYSRLTYHVQILGLQGRHWLFMAWLKTRSFCFTCYKRYICQPLMLCGLMKIPTWAEIEAYRLHLITQSGFDIPRPAVLEEGLRQEQER